MKMIKRLLLFSFIACSTILNGQDDQSFVLPMGDQLVGTNTPAVSILTIEDPIDFSKTMEELQCLYFLPEVEGVLLKINSLGGEIGKFSALSDTIKEVSRRKSTVSYVYGNALSGGYLLASGSESIIAARLSQLGSIGLMGPPIPQLTERMSAGKYKKRDLSSTDEIKKRAQEELNSLCGEFKKNIEENRQHKGLTLENSDEWAQGKCFTAPEAIDLKLIDGIGGRIAAENLLIKMIHNKRTLANRSQ